MEITWGELWLIVAVAYLYFLGGVMAMVTCASFHARPKPAYIAAFAAAWPVTFLPLLAMVMRQMAQIVRERRRKRLLKKRLGIQ
jgi:hypothetical protein